MEDIGYSLGTIFPNLQSVAIALVVYLVELCVFAGVKIFHYITKSERLKSFAARLQSQLFFSEILTILLEAYLEITIAVVLNLRFPAFEELNEKLSLISSYTLLALSQVVLPCLLIFVVINKNKAQSSESFNQLWSPLFEGVHTGSRFRLAYRLMFIMRRQTFLATAFFVDTPIFQIFAVLIQNEAFIIY